VPGDVDVQDSSTVVTYDEEAVKHTELMVGTVKKSFAVFPQLASGL